MATQERAAVDAENVTAASDRLMTQVELMRFNVGDFISKVRGLLTDDVAKTTAWSDAID